MEQTYEIAQVLQDAVLRPDFRSALGIFTASLLNELIAILPAHVILSSQLIFLKGSLSMKLFAELSLFVALPVGMGTTLGSLATYGLAYFGGKPAIEKYGRYLRLSWSSVEKVESKFKGTWYDEVLFVALRTIPLLPSLPINVAAGILRMRFLPYFTLTLVGTIIKIMTMFFLIGVGMEVLVQ